MKKKEISKNRPNKRFWLVFFLIVFIFILSLYLGAKLVDHWSILQRQEIEAGVIISDDRYGIEANGTALKFGMIPSNDQTTSIKSVSIQNDYPYNVKVQAYVKGALEDYLAISQNDFVLAPGQKTSISFSISGVGLEPGNYTSIVTILIRNPVVK